MKRSRPCDPEAAAVGKILTEDPERAAKIRASLILAGGGEIDPFGGRAYAVFDSNGDLKAVLSFIENSRGEVTAIKVWGKEKEMIFLGVATFIIVCGDENLSDGSEEIFNSLLEKNYCIRKGFKVVFKDEGDGYGSFTITGA